MKTKLCYETHKNCNGSDCDFDHAVQMVQVRKELRRQYKQFKEMCRIGAINIALAEKIEKERSFRAAIQSTYAESKS